jgi:hypothetical protein
MHPPNRVNTLTENSHRENLFNLIKPLVLSQCRYTIVYPVHRVRCCVN